MTSCCQTLIDILGKVSFSNTVKISSPNDHPIKSYSRFSIWCFTIGIQTVRVTSCWLIDWCFVCRCATVGSYRSCGVPWSCCLQKFQTNQQCGNRIRKQRSKVDVTQFIETIGCLDKLFDIMRKHLYLVAGVTVSSYSFVPEEMFNQIYGFSKFIHFSSSS